MVYHYHILHLLSAHSMFRLALDLVPDCTCTINPENYLGDLNENITNLKVIMLSTSLGSIILM